LQGRCRAGSDRHEAGQGVLGHGDRPRRVSYSQKDSGWDLSKFPLGLLCFPVTKSSVRFKRLQTRAVMRSFWAAVILSCCSFVIRPGLGLDGDDPAGDEASGPASSPGSISAMYLARLLSPIHSVKASPPNMALKKSAGLVNPPSGFVAARPPTSYLSRSAGSESTSYVSLNFLN
jgi:hypothetical protein